MATGSRLILNLPIEIIHMICYRLSSPADLWNLGLSNKRLRSLCAMSSDGLRSCLKQLYSFDFLRDCEQVGTSSASIRALEKVISSRSEQLAILYCISTYGSITPPLATRIALLALESFALGQRNDAVSILATFWRAPIQHRFIYRHIAMLLVDFYEADERWKDEIAILESLWHDSSQRTLSVKTATPIALRLADCYEAHGHKEEGISLLENIWKTQSNDRISASDLVLVGRRLIHQYEIDGRKMEAATISGILELAGGQTLPARENERQPLHLSHMVQAQDLEQKSTPIKASYSKELRLLNAHRCALSQTQKTVYDAYEEIVAIQNNISDAMTDGRIYSKGYNIDRLEYTSDCRYLVSYERYSQGRPIRIYDLTTPEMNLSGMIDAVFDFAVGPNNLLATMLTSGELKIWSIGEEVSLEATFDGIGTFWLQLSNHYLLLCLFSTNSARIFNWTSMETPVEIWLPQDTNLARISNNEKFVVFTDTRKVQFLPIENGEPGVLEELKMEPTIVNDILISNDDTVIAVFSMNRVDFWWIDDLASESRKLQVPTQWAVKSFTPIMGAFSIDSLYLILGSHSGELAIFIREDDDFVEYLRLSTGLQLNHLAWSPDGQFLALASSQGLVIMDIAERILAHRSSS